VGQQALRARLDGFPLLRRQDWIRLRQQIEDSELLLGEAFDGCPLLLCIQRPGQLDEN